MGYKVAIVGATGNVGREMLEILSDRQFPVDEAFAIASRRSMGVECSFGDRTLKCQDLEQFDFSRADFALMSAGGDVSKEWAPKIAKAGWVHPSTASATARSSAAEGSVSAMAAKSSPSFMKASGDGAVMTSCMRWPDL